MLKAVCTIGIEGFGGGVCCGSAIVAQKIVDVSSVPAERASPWVGLRFSNLGRAYKLETKCQSSCWFPDNGATI